MRLLAFFIGLTILSMFAGRLYADTEATRRDRTAYLANRWELWEYKEGVKQALKDGKPGRYQERLKAGRAAVKPDPDAVTDIMCILGFICGLLSLLVFFVAASALLFGLSSGVSLVFFGLFISFLGVIFSAIGIRNVNNNSKRKGRGLAVAGLIIGLVVLFIALISVVAVVG